jgi:hypothetical protein
MGGGPAAAGIHIAPGQEMESVNYIISIGKSIKKIHQKPAYWSQIG